MFFQTRFSNACISAKDEDFWDFLTRNERFIRLILIKKLFLKISRCGRILFTLEILPVFFFGPPIILCFKFMFKLCHDSLENFFDQLKLLYYTFCGTFHFFISVHNFSYLNLIWCLTRRDIILYFLSKETYIIIRWHAGDARSAMLNADIILCSPSECLQ